MIERLMAKRYGRDEEYLPKENEPLLDESVVEVITQYPLTIKNCPFSPFQKHNRIFLFSGEFFVFGSIDLNRLFNMFVNSLIETKGNGKGIFRFSNLDSLEASKSEDSSISNPIDRWPSMSEFGRYAYNEHLPESNYGVGALDTKSKKEENRERLKRIVDDAVDQNLRFTSVTYLNWCDRYVLDNSGRSRRYAAVSHLAKNGDEYFDKDIEVDLDVETLSKSAIADIDSIADTYVFFTSKKYARQLEREIPSSKYPVGYFRSEWSKNIYRTECLFIVALLKEEYIEEMYTQDDIQPHYHLGICERYINSQARLKPQFDGLLESKCVLSINDFIDVVEKTWKK